MRASRLLELLLLLQLRGRATVPALAAELEVSVRTVHRDLDALAAAGVPLYTERGRSGGVRLVEGYRVGGLPGLNDAEARGVLLVGAPAVARDLGLDTDAEQKLLAAMDARAAAAARSLRDRLLVEPDGWFEPRQDTPFLLAVARGVWERRELRLTYPSASAARRERVIQPLGLVLKGGTWYLLGRPHGSREDRVYRLSRVTDAALLDHRFDPPADFSLVEAWESRKEAFAASIPSYPVLVRVAPDGEALLHLLQEGTPPLPLARDVERDTAGWAIVPLRFERPDSAASRLLQLGAQVEVLRPPDLRQLMAESAQRLVRLYRRPTYRGDRTEAS